MRIRNSYKWMVALLLTLYAYTSGLSQSSAIVKSAIIFLRSLPSDQVKKAQYSFSDTLRQKWSNFPVGMVPREGVQYGLLSDSSRVYYHDFLLTLLTSQGYLKITSIMQLDDILNILTQQSYDKGEIRKEQLENMNHLKWGYDNYYIAIWGTPSEKEPWGFSMGGHHLALNLTMNGSNISFTPLFIGTDPAQVQTSKYSGLRVLSKEEDYGFLLLNFLSKEQKAKAILSTAVPKDIITNPQSSQRITTYSGIQAKEFNKDQTEVFKILIQEYLHNFDHAVAHGLYDKIEKNGFESVYFAWIGGTERHTPHYYIINGPDFLIEYDNVGFQNDGNHIHAILREKENDFGVDILKEHYLNSEHHKK